MASRRRRNLIKWRYMRHLLRRFCPTMRYRRGTSPGSGGVFFSSRRRALVAAEACRSNPSSMRPGDRVRRCRPSVPSLIMAGGPSIVVAAAEGGGGAGRPVRKAGHGGDKCALANRGVDRRPRRRGAQHVRAEAFSRMHSKRRVEGAGGRCPSAAVITHERGAYFA